MLRKIEHKNMGSSESRWLKSLFHFSFANYHNPNNINFGVLRVVNDDKKDHKPNYGDFKIDEKDRKNKWFHMVSAKNGEAPIQINQDTNFYVIELDKDKETEFLMGSDRQAYIVQIEGSSEINDINLSERDAMEVVEENLKIKALENIHLLVIEMKKA